MSIPEQDLSSSNKLGKVYECPAMSKKITKNLVALHESREFPDVVLIGRDGTQIRTHRIILCASTQYFEETIRSMPNNKKPLEIEVKEFESGTLESVLQYMYTGSVDFCLETVRQVLAAANHFKIQPLMDLCYDFMRHELNNSNCLETSLFAKQHDNIKLYEESFSFACNHFEEICFGIDFLNQNEEMVDNIVSNDKIVVSSEEKVVQSLLMWLNHDRKNREENWEQRLLNVRYQFLTHLFILENTSNLCINLDCHKLISLWLEWHVLPETRLELPEPRKSYQTAKLFIVTGYYLSSLTIQTYYPQFNTWTYEEMESSWDDLYNISAIVEKGTVIIAGGVKKDGKRTNEIKFYNMETQERGLLPSMRQPRSGADVAILNGYLYVIGGRGLVNDMLTNLKSVERYDLSEQKWEDVATLLSPIYNSQTVVLNDCLYVVDSYSTQTQCYNVKENRWSFKASKTEKCDHFGVASIREYLFTVGGRHKNGQLSSTVERYNPLSDTWDIITSLRSPRCQPKCLGFHNSFIVLGGIFDMEWIDTVEEYNIETKEWKTLAPLLVLPLSIRTLI